MFSQAKVAVLESKLDIYEDLSREMLAKLEAAVDKISEGNSRIATILARHDQQIEQNAKSDQLLIKMIDEIKERDEKEHEIMFSKFDQIENKIQELSKFRWQVGGVLAVTVIVISTINAFVPRLLTVGQMGSTMERSQPSSTIR
jgi:uncharacterized membrane protein YraQ (UPF0718 family)